MSGGDWASFGGNQPSGENKVLHPQIAFVPLNSFCFSSPQSRTVGVGVGIGPDLEDLK